MAYYQGRALQAKEPRRRPAGAWAVVRRVTLVLGLLAVATAFAHVPWAGLRARHAVITDVRVEGTRYLDGARVAAIARVRAGDDLLRFDPRRARQALLLDSRIATAVVDRRLPRGVRIRVVERVPALLVHHGTPWELDSAGVLLEPLEHGVVADVPLLVGPRLEGLPSGTRILHTPVRRGLAWAEALGAPGLQLAGQVSELDVTRDDRTGITLLHGTRVLAPAWPPSARRLSALRVVLADLQQKGTVAEEVDVRFEHQVIVRPAPLEVSAGRPS